MSDRDEQRATLRRVAAICAITAIFWACGSSATPTPSTNDGPAPSTSSGEPTSSDSASTGPADDGTEPSDNGSSAPPDNGSSAPPDDGPSSGTQEIATVRFGSVPAKRWGDKPFKVAAAASNGAKLAYSANGPCVIGGSTGIVTIKAVGTCQLTARTASGPAARDTASVVIRKGLPKITFKGRSVAYSRPFSVLLKASATLPITIKFRRVSDPDDKSCRVQGAKLTLGGDPALNGLPQLRQSCTVQAYADQSTLYETPKPVSATFGIEVPNVNIQFAGDPYTYSYSDGANRQINFTESSHGVGGVVFDDVACDDGTIDANVTPAPTVADKRTVYHLILTLHDPAAASGSYDCTVTVKATPPDYQRNQENFEARVKITVNE